MKLYLGLFALCLNVNVAMAQKKSFIRQRLIINHGTSYSLPFNRVNVNPVIDQLTNINEKGMGIQFLSLNVFIKENLGVELMMHGIVSSSEKNRKKQLITQLEDKFSSQYYADRSYVFGLHQPSIERKFTAALGANYKFERGKFTYIPKFFVGVLATRQSSFPDRFLKERNTNTVVRLDYEGRPRSKGRLLLGPAATVMYRFNSILGVSCNAFYWWHKADVNYSETITNIATNQASVEYYSADKTLHGLTVGLNLSVGFGKRTDRVKK